MDTQKREFRIFDAVVEDVPRSADTVKVGGRDEPRPLWLQAG
jgi:hypothetical protein